MFRTMPAMGRATRNQPVGGVDGGALLIPQALQGRPVALAPSLEVPATALGAESVLPVTPAFHLLGLCGSDSPFSPNLPVSGVW